MIADPAYLLRRILFAVGLVVALTGIVFALYWTIPAEPAFFLVDPRRASPQEIEAARHELGVDRSPPVQYAKFLWRAVHGDLGVSWTLQDVGPNGQSRAAQVRPAVVRAVAVSGSLLLGGGLLLLAIALPLGAFTAARPRSKLDRIVLVGATLTLSTQPVVVGALLQSLFGSPDGPLPARGYCNLFGGGECSGPVEWARHLVLPWATFALVFLALYVRVFRARMIEVLREPYIQVAYAKGSSELRVLSRHAFRNAASPVLTMLGMDIGVALGISIYLEKVYRLPGLGTLTFRALSGDVGYDLPLLLAIALVVGCAVVFLNLLVDLLYAVVDPTLAHRERSIGARGPG